MVRVEFEVGLYNEHFERFLKWYTLAFKGDKSPNADDEKAFHLLNILVSDMRRQDKEEDNNE